MLELLLGLGLLASIGVGFLFVYSKHIDRFDD